MERDFNIEDDLRRSDKMMHKVQTYRYAQALYAALCNVEWIPKDTMQLLKSEGVIVSWRYAGGVVSRMRDTGDYMDFYCSGINDECYPEGTVTDEIRSDLNELGWVPKELPTSDSI